MKQFVQGIIKAIRGALKASPYDMVTMPPKVPSYKQHVLDGFGNEVTENNREERRLKAIEHLSKRK